MKNPIFLICAFVLFQATAQTVPTTKQWQEDLRFLQETIHKDYSSLFVKTTPEAFDAEVDKLYGQIPELQPHEVIVGLSRMIALFQYGHTDISFRQPPFEFHSLPLNLYQYKDGVYLQGVHKEYEKALGAKVISINKVPIQDAMERVRPAVNAENDQYFKAYGLNYLRIPEVLHAQGITENLEERVEFTLEKDGTVFKQQFATLAKGERVPTNYSHVFQNDTWLETREQNNIPLYLKNLDKIYFFEYLPEEKTVYVRHSQIYDDPQENIPTFYDRVFDFIENNDVEKLVLDVRLNGGGNNYKNKDVVTRIIESKKINKVGRFFVLIGRRTFSACQNLVNELDNYTNVIFVGEPTSENINFWGDARPVRLPNSQIPVYLSFAWWQDKPAWENADWLAPTIPVEMTFEQYRTNQDLVLDAALSFSGEDFKPNPMQYITDLYVAGKMAELSTELPKMIQDPRYSFVDFEGELSARGHLLLNSGREAEMQGAIQVFGMIAQLFPDSAQAWKNLGEGYLKVGNKQEAVPHLKKAIAMDADGKIGKAAKILLEQGGN